MLYSSSKESELEKISAKQLQLLRERPKVREKIPALPNSLNLLVDPSIVNFDQ